MKKKYFHEKIELCCCKIIIHRKDSYKDRIYIVISVVMIYTTTTTTTLTLNIQYNTVSK